jgi:CO dehydrogenase nickel-insertion accessory protein CooC1
MDTEQQHVVLAAVNTILRFLRNDNKYVPFRATVMGCGGTGKSYIINTILTTVRKMTRSNTTLIIGAPSGSAAFNVQGSTLHHLLGISVARPEDKISQKIQEKLQKQLESVLCLIIDKRSMSSSKVLAAAERNVRITVYN